MAPHFSTLAWKIPWMEEPGGLQSMGSRRVGQDWATSLSLSLSCIGEGNGNPLQCSCLENPMDGGAWWAAAYGVAQSRTRLTWLSSSSREESFISWGLLWWCDSGMCVGVCTGVCVLGAGGLIALYTYFSFPGFSPLPLPPVRPDGFTPQASSGLCLSCLLFFVFFIIDT